MEWSCKLFATLLGCALLAQCVTGAWASSSPGPVPNFRTAVPKPFQPAITEPTDLVTQSGQLMIPHGKCWYFLEKARATGDRSFMRRYEACEDG